MRRLRPADDTGMTMIELVVYSVLAIGVLLIVGSMLLNGMRGQASVTAITTATNSGQLAASAIQNDVRNSSRIKVITVGNDQLVQARIAGGTSSTVAYHCAAWYYSKATGEIRSNTSPSRITAPNASALAGWTLIASGIKPAGPGGTVFTGTSSHLEIAFTVAAGSTEPVTITSSATSRNPNSEDTPSCFS